MTQARLSLLAAALIFSVGGAAIKACALTSWQIAGFRSGIAAVAVWLILPDARRGYRRPVLLVSLAYAATVLLFALANKLTTSANTIFLQSTGPLYILLLAPLLLREKTLAYDWAVIGIIAVGMSFFFLGSQAYYRTAPDPGLGNALAAASGLSWALTVMGLRWISRAGGSSGSAPAVVVAGNAIAFVVALPFALPIGHGRPVDWILIVGLGVVQIGVAYVFLVRGMRYVPALEASVLLLLEPALNPLWAWIIHGERPGPWSTAGGLLILGATTLKTWLDSSRGFRPRTARPAP